MEIYLCIDLKVVEISKIVENCWGLVEKLYKLLNFVETLEKLLLSIFL